jgi:polyhydroxybutyrate depolymerase
MESYLQIVPEAESRGFLYCYPEGIQDLLGKQFWNATDACCNFHNLPVDDVAFLRNLIGEINRVLGVDPRRIYLIGHSNGGFMCYRMACETADMIAGIAAIAAATFYETNSCQPSEPVNILHIHGTSDPTILYEGAVHSATGVPYPGAVESIERWAGYNGCTDIQTDPNPTLDLVQTIGGLDTTVTRYNTYPPGGAVELWTVQGAGHGWPLSSEFTPLIVGWLLAHPKPLDPDHTGN